MILAKRLLVAAGAKRNNLNRFYSNSRVITCNLEKQINQHNQLLSYRRYLRFTPPYLVYQNKYPSANMSTGSINEEHRHLDFDQLNEVKDKPGSILIDVREKEELAETGILPGAQHIPVGEIAKALSASDEDFKKTYKFNKPAQDSNLIFSCRSGKRSLVALEVALANGYSKQVLNC